MRPRTMLLILVLTLGVAPVTAEAHEADRYRPAPRDPGYGTIAWAHTSGRTFTVTLTSRGRERAMSCSGAREIAAAAAALYQRLPQKSRTYTSIAWALGPMATEIRAHAAFRHLEVDIALDDHMSAWDNVQNGVFWLWSRWCY